MLLGITAAQAQSAPDIYKATLGQQNQPTAEISTEELRRIQCPTLVIHGKADKLMPTSAGEAVAQAIPSARLELIEGMGHDLPRELWPRITRSIADNAARAKPVEAAAPARA